MEKSWISSCSAIFIGLSFLLTALVETTLFYYSNTLNEVPMFMKILISGPIVGLGLFLIIKVFTPLIENYATNIPAGLSGKYIILLQICLIFFISSIAVLIIVSSPRAILAYKFVCPDELINDSKITISVQNDGQIYGNYKIYSTSNNNNIYFLHERSNQPQAEFTIPPLKEQSLSSSNINVFFKEKPTSDNITVINGFDCIMFDCTKISYADSENLCFYKRVGRHYYKRDKT